MLLVHRATNADGATAAKSKGIAVGIPGCHCQLSCPNVYSLLILTAPYNRFALYCANGKCLVLNCIVNRICVFDFVVNSV